MEELYVFTKEGLHLSRGNDKLGNIWNISFIPGNLEHRPTVKIHDKTDYKKILDEKYITNVIGTCSKHCTDCANQTCYAFAALTRYHNKVAQAWSENTNLLYSGKLFEVLDRELNRLNADKNKLKVEKFRINDSGELRDYKDMIEWNNLAKKHKEIIFSLYTKNFEAIDEFIQLVGAEEDNMIINISQWNHCADDFLNKYPNRFNIFEYDGTNRRNNNFSEEDKERLSHLHHCPAVTKEGHRTSVTCSQCKNCYQKGRKIMCVYSH